MLCPMYFTPSSLGSEGDGEDVMLNVFTPSSLESGGDEGGIFVTFPEHIHQNGLKVSSGI